MNTYKMAWLEAQGDLHYARSTVNDIQKESKSILKELTANDSKARIAFHIVAPFLIPWVGTAYNSVGWAVAAQGPRALAELALVGAYAASLADYAIDSNLAHNAMLTFRQLATGDIGENQYKPLNWIFA